MADGKPGRPLPALSRDVAHLCDCVREKWQKLVSILEEEEKPLLLSTISVIRTTAQQENLIKEGVSWTRNSLHLPQKPHGKSLAIDVCPVPLLHLKNWSPSSPLWDQVGRTAAAVGLGWGVWVKGKTGALENIDKAHLYAKEKKCTCPPTTSERADRVVAELESER